jgi:DNA-binding LytR/AlgR family response regulator
MIKCVVIDDEQPAINVLQKYILQMPNLQLVGTATNPLVGIDIIRKTNPELVFLDIQMDEMNGMDVMQVLGDGVQVIFCTAYSEFAAISYDLNAVDYLMKPFAFSRFAKAINRVKTNDNTTAPNDDISDDYIFVKTEQKGRMIKVDLSEICYVEARNNYVSFNNGHTQTLVYATMKEIEKFLPANHFMRIHRSYIVALSKITFIENSYISFENRDEKIPIGKNYKQIFTDKMKGKLLSS